MRVRVQGPLLCRQAGDAPQGERRLRRQGGGERVARRRGESRGARDRGAPKTARPARRMAVGTHNMKLHNTGAVSRNWRRARARACSARRIPARRVVGRRPPRSLARRRAPQIKILRKLRHPHIVNLKEVVLTG
eukprot:1570454-Prymnesium_polylepis.1